MAYVRHLLMAMSGLNQEVSAGDEIWECTMRMFPGETGGPAGMPAVGFNYQTTCDALAAALKTWFTASVATSDIPTTAALTLVKLNAIGADGKYEDATNTYQTSVTGASGTNTAHVPSFLSGVYGWKTNRVRGRASRGSMFPPNYALSANAGSATIASASVTIAVARAKALLTAINGVTAGLSGGVLSPAVVSSKGEWAYINGVSISNLWGVQRRRKDAVAATPALSAWP